MISAGQPGFLHAPVSKAIITTVVLATVFGSIIGSQTRLTLRISEITTHFQIWRLFTHNFVFTTPGELLFGVVLLYFFRQFERQLGSSRFAAFAFITTCIYTILLVSLQLFLSTSILTADVASALTPASGPYALIFASVVFFFFETPKIYHFQILGALELSDKFFPYLLTVQLICSSPPRSLISCAAALISGLLYRFPGVRENADTPEPIVSFCSRFLLPWIRTSSRPETTRGRITILSDSQNSGPRGRSTSISTESNDAVPISESNVDTLIQMGFSQEQSISALVRSQDDVQRATDMLLSTSG